MKFGIRIPSIKKRISSRISPRKILRNKVRVPKGLGIVTNPKKAIYNKAYNKTTVKACYIASYIYKDENAWQVELLRNYRDRILINKVFGKYLIDFYYFTSPKLVSILKKIKIMNVIIEKILNRFIKRIYYLI